MAWKSKRLISIEILNASINSEYHNRFSICLAMKFQPLGPDEISFLRYIDMLHLHGIESLSYHWWGSSKFLDNFITNLIWHPVNQIFK